MSRDHAEIPDDVLSLVDGYLAGELDEAGTADLDHALRESALARAYFVRYCKLETDLHATVRARAATSRALASIGEDDDAKDSWQEKRQTGVTTASPRSWWLRSRGWFAASLLLLIAGGLTIWFARPRTARSRPASTAEVAWLVNAQDCEWDAMAAGGLVPGRTLILHGGLAELHMGSGATVVLEGPAEMELVAGDTVRINHGKLAVRAEGSARGFQVLLPQGRLLDLGTEFGVNVDSDGSAKVVVFEGKIQASAGPGNAAITLTQSQSARVSHEGVKLTALAPAGTQPSDIARQIKRIPLPVARHVVIDFSEPAEGTLLDSAGRPTGLPHRLPGTGAQLPVQDPNLRLDASTGSLALTTTRSDLNHRFKLAEGEYLGLRLADLGFTGVEDFEVSVVVPNIPGLAAVGQFGLYAGSRNDLCIRGGLISQRTANRYSQFFVNNEAGLDQNAMYVGLVETGNDVRLTLRRRAGTYSLTVENLTSGASSTLSIRPLALLATERQMFVGFFGANPGSEERQTLSITELSATVWTKQ
jgi:hypothetical protein